MRINYPAIREEVFSKIMALETEISGLALDKELVHWLKIRISQLNKCAFCVDMHTKVAVLEGVDKLKLCHLPVWGESPLFTPREKSALYWAESMTIILDEDNQALFEALQELFTDEEIVELNHVIAMMNFWNRLGVAFKPVPGALDELYGLDKVEL